MIAANVGAPDVAACSGYDRGRIDGGGYCFIIL